jgi:hypothetical protein
VAQIFITYWRDIPSQVSAKAGRRGPKAMLSERFQEAIDMAAMRANLAGSDDYVQEWRRGNIQNVDGQAQQAVTQEVERLEREYDKDRLKSLIDNGGHAA